MSDEESDQSEYLDLPTSPQPTGAGQSDSEGYLWEEDQENLSFQEPTTSTPSHLRFLPRTFQFGEDQHPTSHFPPRHLSSETDFNFLEHRDIPALQPRQLDEAFEEEADEETEEAEEVDKEAEEAEKEDTVLEVVEMDAATQQLINKYDRCKRNWNQNFARHKDQTSILPMELQDMKDLKKEAEELANDVFDAVAEDSEVHTNVLGSLNTIRNNLSALYRIAQQEAQAHGANRNREEHPPPPPPPDHDKEIDRVFTKQMSILERYRADLETLEVNMGKLSKDYPTPTTRTMAKMTEHLNDAKEKRKSAEECHTLVSSDVATYEAQDKKNNNQKKADTVWGLIKAEFVQSNNHYEKYLEKVPSEKPPPPAEEKSSIHLKKLPPPTFSGRKVDYHRFKFDFEQHVTYKEEKDKVLCLKEECLKSKEDKERVANQYTLAKCWEKLDAEHGGPDEAVSEVFKGWRAMRSPTTDKAFVQFVEKIETGISCIESLKKTAELTTNVFDELQEKLDDRMRREINLLVIKKKPAESLKEVVMKYLIDEKKAAQRGLNKNTTKKDEAPPPPHNRTQSNFTNSRGRGGYRGRGQQRGGYQGGQQQGGGQGQRGQGGQNQRGQGSRGRGRGGRFNFGKCLLCEESHSLSQCPRWLDKSTDKRFLFSFCHANAICTYCLMKGHTNTECYSQDTAIQCPCGSDHNINVCIDTEDCKKRKNWKDTSSGNNTVSVNMSASDQVNPLVNGTQIGQAILPIQLVKTDHDGDLNTLLDICSQNTFVKESAARRLKLEGPPIRYTLVTTDGKRSQMNGHLYDLTLVDVNNTAHHIQAIGIKNLSSNYAGFKVIKIKPKLKHYKSCEGINDKKLARDSGQIDLLLGTDLASLHPVKVATVGQLVIMKSVWGTGWTLMGHSDRHIQFTDNTVGTKANCCGVENITHGWLTEAEPSSLLEGIPPRPLTASQASATKDIQFFDQVTTENIGISVKPKCHSCKVRTENCKECAMITKTTTYLEYCQDQQIEANIEKLPDGPGYIASYPYNSEVNLLLPNDNVAMKRAITVENDMKKRPKDLEQINEVITKSFNNGFFKWLSEEEMESYDGPVSYIPYNIVYKESETTPARFCFDSGQVDKNGRSLNSCMGKGSNPLNHFGSVILNFRGAEQVAAGDISKMFNRIQVREQDIHLRRFFMRPDGLGGVQPWKVAACTVVNFGETAAPSIAIKVKNRCADEFGKESPEVTDQIKRHCIMDDINISCKYTENIDERIKKAEEILANGNFSFKQWIKAGEKQQGEKMLGHDPITKSLGLAWKVEQDLLTYRPKLNFSKKKRNRYLEPDTTAATLIQDFPKNVSKRLGLKLQHTVFDPACLIQPWILKMRLAFRDILFYEKENNNAGWDKPLPNPFREQWLKLTQEMFELENLEFPRSIVPRGYNPDILPTLVLFSDGSDVGQCVVAYLVWTMLDGSIHVSLVTSRVKIASLTKITTPRSELCSGQISARLGPWIREELDIKIGDTLHIVDSSIILGMIRNVSLKFDAYTAPRVTEIQSNTDIESWFWTETTENSSDLGTRGKCSISDLDVGTMWREGPSWLKLPRDQWPLRSDFKKHQVPGLKKEFEILQSVSNLTQLVSLNQTIAAEQRNIAATEIMTHSTATPEIQTLGGFPPDEGSLGGSLPSQTKPDIVISKLVDQSEYTCWFKLIRVSAQALKALKIFRKEEIPSLVDLMKEARSLWLKEMMEDTREMLSKKKLSEFIVYEKDGIVYATTRAKQENLNPDDLVILSPTHPLTRKILTSYHNVNHKGVNNTVARSRIFYWIPQASKIVDSIKRKCAHCRLNDHEAMQQLMAPVPSFRLKPAPIWSHSMLDLFGPIQTSDFVNQRTSRKTWAVIITCLNTRALWVYLAESYSTDHLLTVLKKHEARNGCPDVYYADLGRQIIGADRVIAEAIANIDQNQLKTSAAKRGVKFEFGTPHHPAGQGAVERLIAEVKSCLKVIIKYRNKSFAEIDCCLSEASYMVNSRPLQLYPRAGEDGYICPNDILFGRSDQAPVSVPVMETSLSKRAAHKQRVMAEFWDKWTTSYLQTLTKYHRWQTKFRNVAKGDIILMLDKEQSKGKFTLGMVDSVKVDNDGQVRRVVIKYKIVSKDPAKYPTSFKYAERNVRGLALLIKAEERENYENHDFDLDRFQAPEDEEDHDEQEASEHSEETEDNIVNEQEDEGNEGITIDDSINNSNDEEEDTSDNILPPRARKAPQRLNL